ncbi:MAG: hypothetical protein AAF790_06265 [Planctomycetota bacterium]
MNPNDAEHLRLLGIFHYVLGGIGVLLSFFPLIYVVVGVAMLSGAFDDAAAGGAPPREVGWFVIAFGAFFMLLGLTLAIAMILAGRGLSRARNHTLCVVVAAIELLVAPLGTILGILSLVVLMRPSVKELFDANKYGGYATHPADAYGYAAPPNPYAAEAMPGAGPPTHGPPANGPPEHGGR